MTAASEVHRAVLKKEKPQGMISVEELQEIWDLISKYADGATEYNAFHPKTHSTIWERVFREAQDLGRSWTNCDVFDPEELEKSIWPLLSARACKPALRKRRVPTKSVPKEVQYTHRRPAAKTVRKLGIHRNVMRQQPMNPYMEPMNTASNVDVADCSLRMLLSFRNINAATIWPAGHKPITPPPLKRKKYLPDGPIDVNLMEKLGLHGYTNEAAPNVENYCMLECKEEPLSDEPNSEDDVDLDRTLPATDPDAENIDDELTVNKPITDAETGSNSLPTPTPSSDTNKEDDRYSTTDVMPADIFTTPFLTESDDTVSHSPEMPLLQQENSSSEIVRLFNNSSKSSSEDPNSPPSLTPQISSSRAVDNVSPTTMVPNLFPSSADANPFSSSLVPNMFPTVNPFNPALLQNMFSNQFTPPFASHASSTPSLVTDILPIKAGDEEFISVDDEVPGTPELSEESLASLNRRALLADIKKSEMITEYYRMLINQTCLMNNPYPLLPMNTLL